MKSVGVDLHKKTISVCVMKVVRGKRKVLQRRRFLCRDPLAIRRFFQDLGPFQLAVEATASYEWFVQLLEDLAHRVALAHPKKLRVIAESTRKSDKIDAEVLATFLALDMLPEAWRPTPRIREWRNFVRHRFWLQGRITAVKCKIRHKLAMYNQDITALFTQAGQRHLAGVDLRPSDRFTVKQLQAQLQSLEQQLDEVDAELAKFARGASQAEQEARHVLSTIPQVGTITIDVILSELGDFRRFRSQDDVAAYAGLAPGFRESGQKRHEMHITKEGSPILRWALIQAAWRLVRTSRRWGTLRDHLQKRTGSKKKAIVAVARRLLCVMFSVLRSGQEYRLAA